MPRKTTGTEKRDKAIPLTLTPSLSESIKTLAESQGLSRNEFVIRLLEKTVEKNREVIDKFQKAKNDAKLDFVEI